MTTNTCHKPITKSPARNPRSEKARRVDETRRAKQRREREMLKEHLLTAACQRLADEPPAEENPAEENTSVGEKERARFERVRNAIRAQGKLFAAQGSIVASWKSYQGKRLGPYYRVAYRLDGKQKSLYLGASEWLVAQVQELLTSLQSLYREHRTMERLKRQARQALVQSKRRLARLLHTTFGATTKGWEFRGVFRALRTHAAQREQAAYDTRAAQARRVIRGEPAETKGVERQGKGVASWDMTCEEREWTAAA